MEELVRALCRGELQKVENQLSIYPFLLDEVDENHCTPILYAVLYNHFTCVEYLIKQGANVNAQDKNGTTSLMIASSKNYLDILQLLLKAGALLEIRNSTGKTALLYADENQHNECAKLLINAGACLFTGENSDEITWMKPSNEYVQNAVNEAKREWEKQKEIANALKKGIAQYALSNPSLVDIYNHVHRVCSHRIAATPRIPFPALTLPSLHSSGGITSAHLSNAYHSLLLLSSSPGIQSILYRILDIYCHKDLFFYPSKNSHIAHLKEKYLELNERLRESVIQFEKENEDRRSSASQSNLEDNIQSPLTFPPSHLIHCSPKDELSSLILQRDEIRREIVHNLKDVLLPEKKYEAQRKYDYLERVIGLMKEWYTLMGNSSSTLLAGGKDAHGSPSMKRQSSYISPTNVLYPQTSSVIDSLNAIPLYEDAGRTIKSTTASNNTLDDSLNTPRSHVPPIRDVFHAVELFIQNLSVWYVVASQSPIHETNMALKHYESCLEEYHQSLGKFYRLQHSCISDTHSRPRLTDVTLNDPEESLTVEDDSDSFLMDPSPLLEKISASINTLHAALDQEEYYWTRDPVATLYPSIYSDLQRILDYLTTLALDIKKSLLEGFTSLKEKEKELQQVVLWIAGSPSYEYGMETLEGEVRLLKRDIIRYQREYEDKIHDMEKQRRKSGGSILKSHVEDLKSVESQLISSQIEYQYKSDQLNVLRKDLCILCLQTFPEIAISTSSYFSMTPVNSISTALTTASTSFPYPPIFSLQLLLSTHLHSSLHFLYQHAPLLSHGILQYHRSLEDYLNLTLVSSSERYLTYKAIHKNKEVYIKKYHITSSSSGFQSNAVVSVSEQSLTQFEKLYLEALRLTEISHSQRHSHTGNHDHADDFFLDVQSLFISTPSSPTPSVYLVFPSYQNGNLVQFLASYDAQLSLLSRVSLMKGLCSALSYLHDHLHILHCNLKLENVLISSNYRCLLSDYDISYLGDTNRYNGTVHTPSKGFLDYMPPENLPPNSLPMSMASDVYCYGICLLRVLNKPLCRNRDNGLHAVGYYDREDTKNGFKELAERILSFDPNKRPSTSEILSSTFYQKWTESNWTVGKEPIIEEGSISRSDREEIEKIKKGDLGKKCEPHGHTDESKLEITQPSRNVVQQVYIQRQRVCVNCGFETDMSQGITCNCSSSSKTQGESHFVCCSCLNQYIHSECSVDIASRRWLKVFDKNTKEEFHVRRSAEHILPYFTTKSKCHVEGIETILEKNPWSDLHEFNHEFDVRDLYEDPHDMMKIICPAYHSVPDLREKSKRCENLLSKDDFLKFLTPQTLYEFERSNNELLEWKLTWEYSFRVTEERKHLLNQIVDCRQKELRQIQQHREDGKVETNKVPQYIEMIQNYIKNDIHCVRCPQCNHFVGNGKKVNEPRDDISQNSKEEAVISHDVIPLLSDASAHPSDTLPSGGSPSYLAVIVCPSCSDYFCSICLTDCGGLSSRSMHHLKSGPQNNCRVVDATRPIYSLPVPYSGNEEEETIKRKKYFHCLTCPYNSYGRLWLSKEEFEKLQEDRIESMTSDFLHTLPPDIKTEYINYTQDGKDLSNIPSIVEGNGEVKKLKEIEI